MQQNTMNQSLSSSFHLFFILFLLYSSNLSASKLQGYHQEVNLNEIGNEGSPLQIDGSEFVDLMGSEICQNGDEECLKRRMVSEAHLDYIYTQQNNP